MCPVNLSLGAFAFAALGESFAATGAIAGLLGAALSVLGTAALGYRGVGIHVPRSVTGALLGTFAAAMTVKGLPASQLAPAAFLMLMFAGVFQSCLGVVRLGSLVQYCPQPVMAGFLNAMAVLLAMSQFPHLWGLSSWEALLGALRFSEPSMSPLALPVGLVTMLWILRPPRWSLAIPPPLAGIGLGTMLDVALRTIGWSHSLGPAIGSESPSWPSFSEGWMSLGWMLQGEHLRWMPDILAFALALAVLTSIDHLMSSKALENLTQEHIRPNRELGRLGVMNTVAAFVGVMPCNVGFANSQVHHQTGGRVHKTAVWIAVMLVGLALGLSALLDVVPRASIAGMLLAVAWRMVDKPTLTLAATWLKLKRKGRDQLGFDLLASFAVSLTAVVWGMLVGVAVGIMVAVLRFIAATRRTVIRSVRQGGGLCSRRVRPAIEREALAKDSHRRALLELDGILYFGTVEHFQAQVDALLASRHGRPLDVILDWRRTHYLDLTGAQAIRFLDMRLKRQGGSLRHCELQSTQGLFSLLRASGALVSSEQVYPDADRALEAAENTALSEAGEPLPMQELPLNSIAPLMDLSHAQIERLAAVMHREVFAPGAAMCQQGRPGNEIFLMALGQASVYREAANQVKDPMETSSQARRLACFQAGTCFGELAFVDGSVRDATVRADGTVVAWVLNRRDLDHLSQQDPALANTFYQCLARELVERLRQANRSIDDFSH